MPLIIPSNKISGQRPVLCGRYFFVPFEGAAEHAFTGKAAMETDILYKKVRIFQQIFGGGNPGIDDVLMRRISGFLFESSYKMIGAQAG